MGSRPVFRAHFALVLVCLIVQPSIAGPSGKELLDALKRGDSVAVNRLVRSGAPVNVTDEYGSSALMYAAIYSDAATLKLLLSRGADPNHADQAGATALMWSVSDAAKVRLLVARSANVNAVSTLTGRTPLFIAAGLPGAANVVKLLLDKGADPKVRDKEGGTTLMRAAFNGDPETMKRLIARRVDVNARSAFETALAIAVNRNHPGMVELLLANGADPTPRENQVNPLTYATSYASPDMFRGLVAKGASPKSTNLFGGNLMLAAAASDSSTPEVIQEFIKLGADPRSKAENLHMTHGYGTQPESALDWASRQGETPVAKLLASMTGDRPRSESSGSSPRLGAASPRDAISKALPRLYAGGREFFKRSGCVSCHHNMLQAIAYSAARSRDIAVDAEEVRNNYQQLVAWLNGSREGLFQGIDLPGADTTSGYLLVALEAQGHPRDRATDALAHYLAGSQALDGGFQVRADRAPIESGRATPTALCILALRSYAIPGRKGEFEARIRRAGEWLAAYRARTSEEKSMRLLGLTWAGMDRIRISDAAATLASEQRPDGGWAQLSTLSSDSYATGQALYALHTSGMLSRDSLGRAARYLMRTQAEDGTWHVRSRAYPLQPRYFDTGFPYGRDQWISAAGTSWAVLGLSYALP
jgi:N-acyl-D-amino-acid deacylase